MAPPVSRRHILQTPAGRLMAAILAFPILASPGCIAITIDHGAAAPRDILGRLEPGRTTREQVIAWLGPADEYRRPAAGERTRSLDPRSLHSLEEHDLFGRDRLTYSIERRRHRSVSGLVIEVSTVEVTQSRLVLFFDDNGVLEHAAYESG